MKIDLRQRLTLRSAFAFPLQSATSRRDVLIGGLWLFVPIVGWLMNIGHRIRVVHRMHHGLPPWPAWHRPLELLRHGTITYLGMVWYGLPSSALFLLGALLDSQILSSLGMLLAIGTILAVPGYMSHYCRAFDPWEIFDPFRALRRVWQAGWPYWHAWSIVLVALCLSTLGVLAFGVGFAFTSVWFWQVAAFCFATVFTQRFGLDEHPSDRTTAPLGRDRSAH